jgi:serine/threonine protein kinase
MSPEQLNGQPDPASDQYSLGILLYEILAGRRPFVEPDMMALMLKHNMTPPPSIREFEPRVPEEIDNVILKMLSKKPAERFSSIQEVQDAISDKLLYLPWPTTIDFTAPTDVSSERSVAVKIIQNKLAQEEEFRKRFHREVKVSENLKHPNIVELLDSGEHEDHLYLVLEFVDGEDLSSQITEGGHPLKDMIGLLESILDGLSYAHGLGVVHRDLKPQNIMLTSNRVPKIADFGLARSEELAKLTKTGQAVGTPAYFPPEQVTGAPPTPAADQYSLGIVFYELLCGVRPFNKKNPMELLFQHLSEEPVSPTQHRKDLPPLAAEIILRMLAKNPEARLENLAVVKEGLRAAVNGENWSLPLQPVAIETSVPSVSVAPIASGQNDETINFGVSSQDG